jgi:hypothetical protein
MGDLRMTNENLIRVSLTFDLFLPEGSKVNEVIAEMDYQFTHEGSEIYSEFVDINTEV